MRIVIDARIVVKVPREELLQRFDDSEVILDYDDSPTFN